jgi:uncharacterized protein (TIGR02996 family)
VPEHPGFLQDIIEHPDDDTPRLIYADWLDEHGQAERATFIRTQCAFVRFLRDDDPFEHFGLPADELLPAYKEPLLAPLCAIGLNEISNRYEQGAMSGVRYFLRRGFVEGIEVYGRAALARFIACAPELFALTPLRSARFLPHDVPQSMSSHEPFPNKLLDDLLALPQIGQLRFLDLRWMTMTFRSVRALLAAAHLTPRTTVRLSNFGINYQLTQAVYARFGEAVFGHFRAEAPEEEIPF